MMCVSQNSCLFPWTSALFWGQVTATQRDLAPGE